MSNQLLTVNESEARGGKKKKKKHNNNTHYSITSLPAIGK